MDLRVRIVVDRTEGQVIYCNQHKFVIQDIQAYREVKNCILSYRKSHETYPFHVTEIDIPNELLGIGHHDQAQSLHYLNYKQKIEEKLNI